MNEWRPQVEARASQALGLPVRIGRIQVQSRGWIPALQLEDVALVDAQGREALKLPRVEAAVSARSLFALTLRFEQLLIENAELDIRRDAQGHLFIAGLPVRSRPGGGDAALDWFFEQHEFAIRHGSVHWRDELRQATPLELRDVDLVVRNGLRHHEMRLDATPPPEWGDRFTLQGRFTQPLLARSGDFKRWSGTLHAQLPRADVSELRRHVALPFELSQGQGALRAWVDFEKGDATAATVDAALGGVSLKLQKTLEPLALQQLQGRFTVRRSESGVRLGAQGLEFVTGEGQAWPRGNLQLSWDQRQDQPGRPITGGELSADHLDIGLMAEVAGRLPLGEALRKLLDALAPKGQVQGLVATWRGPLDAPDRYQVKARLSGLSIAAGPAQGPDSAGRPGWRNASVDLRAGESGGEARLVLDEGALEFPGVFEQPVIALDKFSARLAWRVERPRGAPAQVELKVQDARFENADVQGELDAAWRTGKGPARLPGVLDLSGRLSRGQAASVARYLPLGIPATARHYVSQAVRSGRIDSASFRVKGDLSQFPFHSSREGEFHIAGHVSDVGLAYVPPEAGAAPAWPAFSQVSGDLVFDRNSMEIRRAQAWVLGYELTQVQGGIKSLGDNPVLAIEGLGHGALADALHYVNASPVGEWIGQALKPATASGASELKLALSLPLDDLDRSTVKGNVTLQGNDVRLRPDVPVLGNARGRVEFTQKGFTLRGTAARALGGEATIEGGTQADGSTRVQVQGVATAEGLRRAVEVPALAHMASSFSGQTPYRLALGITRGHSEFVLTSALAGLGLDLPAPLRKAAETPMPLRVQSQLLPEGAASAPGRVRDSLRFELGSVVHAAWQRDVTGESAQVLSGAIGVGEPLPPAAPGVAANLNLGNFDADAWTALARRWFTNGNGSAGSDEGYVPRQIALRAQELHVGGRKLTKVVAGMTALPGEPGWSANVVAEQLSGSLEYRPAAANNPGRVHARLARLSLPPSEVESVENLLDQTPASLPALDVVVDDFELRGKRLGKLEIEAVNRGEGSARDWRLARFNLTVPEAQLQASGQWSTSGPARRRMVMNFKLDVSDSGALLNRLGTPGALKGGKGRLQGQVSWAGSPLTLDYPSMSGQLNLSLDNGQFLKAGPGAARLLGVLSLQSLPRRLVLDFRDVFQEGFAFDHATGDVQIREGVASTNNLRMRGLQAAVLMEGKADIARETQDLHVIVVPEINAGTASLAYAAINPAVGLGTFLAQLFLRKPLMQAGTREFRVTGSWDDPKVDRVERKAGDPLPDFEVATPANAASAPQ